MRGVEAAAPAALLLRGAAARAQAVLAPKGNLADLLALFFRDDLQGWAGRRNPAARSWLREPQLRALVDANLAKCLARLRDAAPDPAPPVRPSPPLAPVASYLCTGMPELWCSRPGAPMLWNMGGLGGHVWLDCAPVIASGTPCLFGMCIHN